MKRDPNAVYFDRRVGWSIKSGGQTISGFLDKANAAAARRLQEAQIARGDAPYTRQDLIGLGIAVADGKVARL